MEGERWGQRKPVHIELPPHLEELWEEKQSLLSDPRIDEALELIYRLGDPLYKQSYINLMFIERIHLLDGRARQLITAMNKVREALASLPNYSREE